MIRKYRYCIQITIGIFIGSVVGFSLHGMPPGDYARIADILNIRPGKDDSSGLEIYSKAPVFSLYSIEGNRISLEDSAGTPAIINFWATWCTPCLIEMPILQKRFDAHQSDLIILAVNSGESKTTVSKFIEEKGYSFPALLDPTRSVVKKYQIRAYPTTYFVDGQGIIQAIHVGVLSDKDLDKYLRKIGVVDG